MFCTLLIPFIYTTRWEVYLITLLAVPCYIPDNNIFMPLHGIIPQLHFSVYIVVTHNQTLILHQDHNMSNNWHVHG